MNRILAVARMQLANRQTFIWIPLLILGAALAVTFVIAGILHATVPHQDMYVGGGAQAPLWYFFAIGISAMSYTFPFSQAMSVTRREFFLGTMLTALGTAVGLAAIFTIGGLAEQATDGFGLRSYFFRLVWIWEAGWFVAFLFWVVGALSFFTVGFWFATIYRRFSGLGLATAIVGITLVFLGLAVLITRVGAWGAVWDVIVAGGPLGATGLLAVILVLLSATGYLSLRRATP